MLILAKASMAMMLGFILSLITGLFVVPLFRKLHFGQSVSKLINERHLKKKEHQQWGYNFHYPCYSIFNFTLY